MSDYNRLARAEAAIRWIYERGIRTHSDRPDFVNDAINDAYELERQGVIVSFKESRRK